MIAGWHGVEVPIAWLREVAGTDQSGTSLRALAVTGRRIGLDVEPVKVSRDRLDDLNLPAILHWDSEHWVVLVQVDERRVEIADPGLGLQQDRPRRARPRTGTATRRAITPTGTTPEVPAAAPHLRWLVPFLVKHRRALIGALVLALVGSRRARSRFLSSSSTSSTPSSPTTRPPRSRSSGSRCSGSRSGARSPSSSSGSCSCGPRRASTPTRWTSSRRGCSACPCRTSPPGASATSSAASAVCARSAGSSSSRESRRCRRPLRSSSGSRSCSCSPRCSRSCSSSRHRCTRSRCGTPRPGSRPLYAGIEHSFGRYASDQIDLLKGIETVKSTGTEAGLRRRLQRAFADLTGRTVDSYRTIAAFGSLVQLISLVMYSLFVTLAALEVKPNGPERRRVRRLHRPRPAW